MTYHDKLIMIEEGIKELHRKIVEFEEENFINLDEDNIIREVQDAQVVMLEVCATMSTNNTDRDNNVFNLNEDQSRIFNKITKSLIDQSLNKCSSQIKLFVSGVGGTGKSYLLKALKVWIHNKFPNLKNNEPFGNFNILLFGDLLQLQPVNFNANIQQDAQEFLSFVINALKTENYIPNKLLDCTVKFVRKCFNCNNYWDDFPINPE
uniref:ATP-dependent DNA helicase n=1 Tax=Rhodnius prolixus TaxID=13249 RepID=T1HJQ8_RHOPR